MYLSHQYRELARRNLKGKWMRAIGLILICTMVVLVTDIISTLYLQSKNVSSTLIDLTAEIDEKAARAIMISGLIDLLGILIALAFVFAESYVYLSAAYNITPNKAGFLQNLKRAAESATFSLYLYIRILLWTLLLIIPGIIKALSYSMATFIKLENPELSYNQAIERSMQMMHTNKFNLFCLILSFIGYFIVVALITGILGLFIGTLAATLLTTISVAILYIYVMTAVALFYRNLKGEDIKQLDALNSVPGVPAEL
ncbi:MAG: DUF975 family protein [Firmicutes bacterium]|nr:DUF975 family protein [Bacillota bacterium]